MQKILEVSGALREQGIILYMLLRDEQTPVWAKVVIVATLGYFIWPLDLIPDYLPFGYTDDLAAISALLCTLDRYVTAALRQRAQEWHP